MSSNASPLLKYERVNNCEVVYSSAVTLEEVLKCVDVFISQESGGEEVGGFKGKGQPMKIRLRSNLNLIFRRNKRGGIIGKVIRSKYILPLSFPKNSRPFKEFLCLKHLREVGIPVPEPILAIVKRRGFTFYEGGLFTKEIPQASTLLDLVEKVDVSLLREYAYSAGLWVARALDLGYLHPDLHLGNVLVRSSGISLIDFDKYKNVRDKSAGIKYLQLRWNRGVIKRVKSIESQKVLKESFLSGIRHGERT